MRTRSRNGRLNRARPRADTVGAENVTCPLFISTGDDAKSGESSKASPSGLSSPVMHHGAGIHYAQQVASEDEHLTGLRCIVDLDGAMASRIRHSSPTSDNPFLFHVLLCFLQFSDFL
jgi:hypothetical protein